MPSETKPIPIGYILYDSIYNILQIAKFSNRGID